jgi:hypothetical protein
LHDGRLGAALAIRVTPRSSRNEITEILPDGTVKVHLISPLIDTEANKSLIKFMADVLGVKLSQIEIIAGVSGHDKLLSILDIDTEEAHQRLAAYLE